MREDCYNPYRGAIVDYGIVMEHFSEDGTARVQLCNGQILDRVPVISREWVAPNPDEHKTRPRSGRRSLPPVNCRVMVLKPCYSYDGALIIGSDFVYDGNYTKDDFGKEAVPNNDKWITPGGWEVFEYRDTGTITVKRDFIDLRITDREDAEKGHITLKAYDNRFVIDRNGIVIEDCNPKEKPEEEAEEEEAAEETEDEEAEAERDYYGNTLVMAADGIRLEDKNVQDKDFHGNLLAFTEAGLRIEDRNGKDKDSPGNAWVTTEDGMTLVDKFENKITWTEDGIALEDANGNKITHNGDGIAIEDANGNKWTGTSAGITMEDAAGNKITASSSGLTLENSSGCKIEMGAASVKINGNLEVLQ